MSFLCGVLFGVLGSVAAAAWLLKAEGITRLLNSLAKDKQDDRPAH